MSVTIKHISKGAVDTEWSISVQYFKGASSLGWFTETALWQDAGRLAPDRKQSHPIKLHLQQESCLHTLCQCLRLISSVQLTTHYITSPTVVLPGSFISWCWWYTYSYCDYLRLVLLLLLGSLVSLNKSSNKFLHRALCDKQMTSPIWTLLVKYRILCMRVSRGVSGCVGVRESSVLWVWLLTPCGFLLIQHAGKTVKERRAENDFILHSLFCSLIQVGVTDKQKRKNAEKMRNIHSFSVILLCLLLDHCHLDCIFPNLARQGIYGIYSISPLISIWVQRWLQTDV